MLANRTIQAASSVAGYQIQKSLRFRASANAYLQRTFGSPTNNIRWTWSCWIKRGRVGVAGRIFGVGTDASGVNQTALTFNGGDDLDFFIGDGAGSTLASLRTTQLFRDPSAWYHIVFIYDSANGTANNRMRMFVNGTEVTAFSLRTNPGSSQSSQWNQNGTTSRIGVLPTSPSNYFDGYLAEVNFVDGQALTPTSFGQIDPNTGVWSAKKYTGTYGNNGFYLDFSDNSSLTTASNVGLGKDASGNTNYWTTNNMSITAGSTYDSMLDVPLGGGGGERGNYCTFSSVVQGAGPSWTFSDANLAVVNGNAGSQAYSCMGTIAVSSGRWYWEITSGVAGPSTLRVPGVGVFDVTRNINDISASVRPDVYLSGNGTIDNSAGSALQSGFSNMAANDIVGVALDADAKTVQFYRNGSAVGTAQSYTPATVSPSFYSYTGYSAVGNFGQRPFTYTPPTGFKALHTGNLPQAIIKKPNQFFDTTLYTGNGSSQSITNSSSMLPDLVWLKNRSGVENHQLFDSVRGVNKALYSNLINTETTDPGVSAFNANGFTLGGTSNTNATSYVAWQWKAGGAAVTNNTGSISAQVSANPIAGFSVISFTSNASGNDTVGHGLGVVPKMILLKTRTGNTYNWAVYHASATSASQFLRLNTTDATITSTTTWGTLHTTTTIGITSGKASEPSQAAIAYVFAEVAGYSKIGSYTGNGSSDGPFMYCGFRPKYVMVKRIDAVDNWFIEDTLRSSSNPSGYTLKAQDNTAEVNNTPSIDILSNGFKIRNTYTGYNTSGGTYIFMAFAEVPFKYTLAR